MSQITGIKAKVNNIIKIMLPILDAEGYAVCPDCDSCVNCGTIGLANLEKRHRGRKTCKAAQEKRNKEAKKKKDGTILMPRPGSGPISNTFVTLRDLVKHLPGSVEIGCVWPVRHLGGDAGGSANADEVILPYIEMCLIR